MNPTLVALLSLLATLLLAVFGAVVQAVRVLTALRSDVDVLKAYAAQINDWWPTAEARLSVIEARGNVRAIRRPKKED